MSTYDTNKYQSSIHKYLRNPNRSYSTPPAPAPSSLTSDYNEKSQPRYQQRQSPEVKMLADSPRPPLLPGLSTEDEQAPLTTNLSLAKNQKQFSITLSTLRTLLRLFIISVLITSVTLLFIFFNNPSVTTIIFLFVNLSEQLLVLCIAKASSIMAFRIKMELKKNAWTRNASAVQIGEQLQRAVKEEGRIISWGFVILDGFAGLGTMVGGIVIAVYTRSAFCTLPFLIMAFQWIIALLAMCDGETVLGFVVIRPGHGVSDEEDSLPTVRDSYRDVEPETSAGDAQSVNSGVIV